MVKGQLLGIPNWIKKKIDELSTITFKHRKFDTLNIDELMFDEHQGSYWIDIASSKITGTHAFNSGFYRLLTFYRCQIAISGAGDLGYVKTRIHVNNNWTPWYSIKAPNKGVEVQVKNITTDNVIYFYTNKSTNMARIYGYIVCKNGLTTSKWTDGSFTTIGTLEDYTANHQCLKKVQFNNTTVGDLLITTDGKLQVGNLSRQLTAGEALLFDETFLVF